MGGGGGGTRCLALHGGKKKKAVKQQKKKGKNDNVQIEQERNANGKVTNNIRSGKWGNKDNFTGNGSDTPCPL